MPLLRMILLFMTFTIAVNTILVMVYDGTNFISPFFDGLFDADWQGQFKLDFAMYLGLSGLWIAWRGGFAPASIVMGAVAAVLGMLVFAPYVLMQAARADGDMRKLLLGVHA